MAKTAILERQQSLEEAIHQCNYHSREHALSELQANIARVLNPREGLRGYGSGPATHFLPIPKSPETRISGSGVPIGEVDEKAQAAFQQELVRVTREEQRLRDLAQQAQNRRQALFDWAVALGKVEDRLLISALTEEDRSDVDAYCREHKRLLRTCKAWTDKLVY